LHGCRVNLQIYESVQDNIHISPDKARKGVILRSEILRLRAG